MPNGQSLTFSDDQTAPPPPPPPRRPAATKLDPQFDWSTAQPVKTAPPPAPARAAQQAAPGTAAPPPPPKLDEQFDWSTAQPVEPERSPGAFVRGLKAAGEREWGYLKGEAKGLITPTLGISQDQATWNPQTNQYEWSQPATPHGAGAVWDALVNHGPVAAAGAALINNFDQFPDWVQNLMAGKQIPESIGQGAVDAWQQLRMLRGVGPATAERPVDVTPAANAAVRGTAQAVNVAKENAPVTGATLGTSAGTYVGAKVGGAIGIPSIGGAVGGGTGGTVGYAIGKLLQKLPRMPGETFGFTIPESDAAISPTLYTDIVNSWEGPGRLSDRQVRGLGQAIMQVQREQQAAAQAAARRAAQARRAAAPAAPSAASQAAPAAPAEEPPGPPPEEPPEGPPPPPEEPPSAMRQEVEQANAKAAADVELRRQAYEAGRRRGAPTPPAAAAPEAAAAEAPTTAPTPTPAAREPLKRSEFPSDDEIARAMPGFNFQSAKEAMNPDTGVGPTKWREYRNSIYSSLTRARAKFEGVPVGSDLTELQRRGVDTSNITTFDQAQEALKQSEGGAQAAPEAPAEAPEAAPATAPTTLADLHDQIEQANIQEENKPHLHGMVDFYGQQPGGVTTAQRELQQVLEEAQPEEEQLTPSQQRRQVLQQNLTEKVQAYDAKLAEMGTKRYAGFSTEALPELIDVGKAMLDLGLHDFGEWSKAMVEKIGEHIEPYLRGVFNQSMEGYNEKFRISPRNPTGAEANNLFNPLEEHRQIGLSAFDEVPRKDFIPGMARRISRYSPYIPPDVIANAPRQALEMMVDREAGNLEHLYNQIPEKYRSVSRQWYPAANGMALDIADKYGLQPHQGPALVASQSPSWPWYENLSIADRIADTVTNQRDTVTTPAMMKLGKEVLADDPKMLQSLKGKAYKDLSDPIQKAWFVRLYDEATNPQSFHWYAPDGTDLGVMTKADGVTPAKLRWQSAPNIAKGISIVEDPSIENIHKQLGNAHKVRSFNNDLLTPNHPAGDVTVDTHAVGAATMRPVGPKDVEVADNFSGGGSDPAGISGTYGIHADAYRKAAERLGILPDQLQSVVWEGWKDMWEGQKSKAVKGKINDIWQREADPNDKMTLDEARKQVIDAAGGIQEPAWFKPWQQLRSSR